MCVIMVMVMVMLPFLFMAMRMGMLMRVRMRRMVKMGNRKPIITFVMMVMRHHIVAQYCHIGQ